MDSYRTIFNRYPEVLFVHVNNDKDYSYMIVWGDDKGDGVNYHFEFKRYCGYITIGNCIVHFSGPLTNIFYKARCHYISPFKSDICEYDPLEWRIVVNKSDSTYCYMKSKSNYPCVDVSTIDSIAYHYYRPTALTGNEIYLNSDLDEIGGHPDISYEECETLTNNKYCFREQLPSNKSITIDILVDKNGNASIYKFSEKSGIKLFDNDALEMAQDICKYRFKPARIRGQDVNSIRSLSFYGKGLDSLW